MKKVIKIILSSIGILFLCMMIFAQVAKTVMKPTIAQSNEKSEFAAAVERADRDCPIPVALGKGEVTGIKLENGYVTYYLKYDHDFHNLMSSLGSDTKAKEALLMCFLCINAQGNNQGDLLMDLLIRQNCGLKVVITESATGRYECKASVEDIKRLRERYQLNPHEALYNLLSLSIESQRVNLPMKVDEGMTMTDYKLEGDHIVITMQIDESLYSIATMRSNRALIKTSMIEEGLKDPESKALFDLCKVSHTGLVYRIVGNYSHDEFVITIPSNEIREFTQTPSNVNIQ